VIPFAQVQSVGPDAVMVPVDDVAHWITTASDAAGLITFDGLKHFKVVDDTGTLLGTPRGLDLDPVDGHLQSLAIHKGGLLGLGGENTTVTEQEIASVGADVVVVRAAPA
jgi:sporulation protein YlmC with PRC-barrel domain